jgi:hypothetical protein
VCRAIAEHHVQIFHDFANGFDHFIVAQTTHG